MPIRFFIKQWLMKNFIKQWLMPPGLLLLLLVAGWWLRRRRPRVAALCFALGLGGLWLMSLPLVVQESARVLETEAPLAPQAWATLGNAVPARRCHRHSRCRA